jgi:hypothetical protein
MFQGGFGKKITPLNLFVSSMMLQGKKSKKMLEKNIIHG